MFDKVVVANKANKDLKDILDWYDSHSGEAGDRFLDELNICITKIASFPSHYKMVTPEIQRCLMKIFPFVIYFSGQQGAIVILRVRHKKQKMLKRFK